MLLRLATALLMCSAIAPVHAVTIHESYAFAKLGEPKYAVNFSHYDYANPAAPKGGKITLAVVRHLRQLQPLCVARQSRYRH